jgi:hypothetical protein
VSSLGPLQIVYVTLNTINGVPQPGLDCQVTYLQLRTGSNYGQTLRGEAFGPMRMQKCPKSILSAFTLEAEVQRTLPPKEPRWQHFKKSYGAKSSTSRAKFGSSKMLDPNFRREAEPFLIMDYFNILFQPKGFSSQHSLVHNSDASPLDLGIV